MFIDEQTNADEAPNGILRFALALAGADPRILTDGSFIEFLRILEEYEAEEEFEGWCTRQEFKSTMKLIRQQLLGFN